MLHYIRFVFFRPMSFHAHNPLSINANHDFTASSCYVRFVLCPVYAGGMNLIELRHFLQQLGCTDALNLDGGGSSTLWAKGFNASGVANYPCDNHKFDHEGERKVANALVVVRRGKGVL